MRKLWLISKFMASQTAITQNIWDQLLFSCEIAHNGKGLISLFQEFSTSIDKAFILAGGLGTGLSFYAV